MVKKKREALIFFINAICKIRYGAEDTKIYLLYNNLVLN
jgi:hypothetical protein